MSSYWDKRAEDTMDHLHEVADKRLGVISRTMQRSLAELTEDAKRILGNYQKRYDLTREEAMAYLNAPADRAEYDRLVAKIATLPDGPEKTELQAKAASGAYRYRITRVEALRENVAIETARISQVIEDQTTGQLRFTATEAYNRSMFAVQKQMGMGFAAPGVDGAKMALNTHWAGANYSQRIWGAYRTGLAETLEESIVNGFLTGRSYVRTAREMRDAYSVTFRQAERLVRTETSWVANRATVKSYEDAEIERYRFLATLDSRTCSVCGGLDGKSFLVSEAQAGVNLPPMHPNDRCTTVADIETGGTERAARGGDGKWTRVPKDMDWEEWKRWQQAGAPGDVAKWRKEMGEAHEKPLQNNGFNDMIDSVNHFKRTTPKAPRYDISQEQIDDILKSELSGVVFPVHPLYNPEIDDNGITYASKLRFGPTKITGIEIGKQSRSSREFLIDTLYHEWLEAEILTKRDMDSAYRKLDRLSNDKRHEWIYKQIDRFFKKKKIKRW